MSSPQHGAGSKPSVLPPFTNEPYTDFSIPENRRALEKALADVRSQFGREYQLWIGGKSCRTERKLESRSPSFPEEIVGVHQRATPELAVRAVEAANQAYPDWSRTPADVRVDKLRNAARIIRERKPEFCAWLIYEAGKTWPEAEADVSEAIDFCEYYAREMVRLSAPPALNQLPGELDEMFYLPLGAGIIIPPWNFPLAILAGMTTAALVTGNTVVIKPSSETPTIAAKFVEVLREAGFPDQSYQFVVGSGAEVGDALVAHPKTRFVAFTGSKAVGLHINELAAKPQNGQIWIKRVIVEMGGKDAIIVDRDADLERAVEGVFLSAFGYQGQKCSACSRAIVDERIYDEFLEKLVRRTEAAKVGPADDPGSYMGPVISRGACRTILDYIEVGRNEGRLLCGGPGAAEGQGYFVRPAIVADVPSQARIFREEIFGPVLAVSKARDFDHALELANDSEYGLTGAVYTTDREKIARARNEFMAGNLYINRKCTGAMVGAHPFGGFNMSGTNSKAGGPDYLPLFLQAKAVAERVV